MLTNLLLLFLLSKSAVAEPSAAIDAGLIKGDYIEQFQPDQQINRQLIKPEEIESNKTDYPYKKNPNNLGPILESASAAVIDEETGKILFAKEAEQKRPLASITKLAAILTYFKTQTDWNQLVAITADDRQPGGKRNLYPQEKIIAKDLVYLALIGSDNDAVTALTRSTGLAADEFAQRINQETRELGLANTIIKEPTGLSPNNISTALDVAKLARQAFREPTIAQASILKIFSFSPAGSKITRQIYNTNQLLDNNLVKITAGKTGSTEAAKYSLTVRAENNQGKKIIVALLGAPTDNLRFRETKNLIWWTFENYDWEDN